VRTSPRSGSPSGFSPWRCRRTPRIRSRGFAGRRSRPGGWVRVRRGASASALILRVRACTLSRPTCRPHASQARQRQHSGMIRTELRGSVPRTRVEQSHPRKWARILRTRPARPERVLGRVPWPAGRDGRQAGSPPLRRNRSISAIRSSPSGQRDSSTIDSNARRRPRHRRRSGCVEHWWSCRPSSRDPPQQTPSAAQAGDRSRGAHMVRSRSAGSGRSTTLGCPRRRHLSADSAAPGP
jgi:hypothetical protein